MPISVFDSAFQLRQQLHTGQISSVDWVRAHLAQIEHHNPQIHALHSVRAEAALAEARQADAEIAAGRAHLPPLYGVPLVLKDACRVKGIRSTFGALPQYAWHTPQRDCELVKRLREAGAIILGRSNVPLLGLDFQCRNFLFPETVNPWHFSYTPGGSSGGAAAAIASGMTCLELGSDLGGSIRYPAHCCGVMGLRPSAGFLPLDDIGPEDHGPVFKHILSLGPMARHLDDLRLMLEVLKGQLSPVYSPHPLRIAYSPSLANLYPDASTHILMTQLMHHLKQDGHHVVASTPPIDWEWAFQIWGRIAGYDLGSAVPALLKTGAGRRLFEGYILDYKLGKGPLGRYLSQGLHLSEGDYHRALTEQSRIQNQMARFMHDYDLWVLPVSPGEAIRRQRSGRPLVWQGKPVSYSRFIGQYLAPTALLGTPVLSLPLGLGPQGLPINFQIHGAHQQDFKLLAQAQQALSPYLLRHSVFC